MTPKIRSILRGACRVLIIPLALWFVFFCWILEALLKPLEGRE